MISEQAQIYKNKILNKAILRTREECISAVSDWLKCIMDKYNLGELNETDLVNELKKTIEFLDTEVGLTRVQILTL